MARGPAGRGPSPRDEASRRGDRQQDGWGNAPWLEEGEEEETGATHTLVGRKTLWGIIFGLGVLIVGVVVGISLVSGGDDSPIDVPAIGEEVPVLSSPGPWKIVPTGPDVEGIPVEGQGQVLFGTGDGRDPEARIALEALPEDPLPRPGLEAEEEMAVAPAPEAAAPVAPRIEQAPPKAAPKLAQPKTIYAPEPEPRPAPSAGGQVLQLGAFSSESRARTAFKALTARFSYLAGLEPMIVPVSRDGETLYRLRTAAGSPAVARDICGRLRVAGEACAVVD